MRDLDLWYKFKHVGLLFGLLHLEKVGPREGTAIAVVNASYM